MSSVFHEIGWVVLVSSVLGVLAIFARQPIVVAYILAGAVLGPHALGLIHNAAFLNDAGHIGVSLLLFLAGLELQPRQFGSLMGRFSLFTVGTGVVFLGLGAGWGLAWGLTPFESIVLGAGCMFSSTILVVKLLPTITLHQKHMGAVCVAVLILQDMLAVLVLLLVGGQDQVDWWQPVVGFPLLTAGVLMAEQWVLRKIILRISSYHESIYLLSLGWCLGIAMLAEVCGLPHEVGAFLAGVSLARNPISAFLFEGLAFMRDFFLVMFFFVLGTQFNPTFLGGIGLPALLLAAVLLWLKPWLFRLFLRRIGETNKPEETAARLGQNSEFALIIAVAALSPDTAAYQMILLTTLTTMVISAYGVVLRYPTPIATQARLKQD